MSLRLAPHEEEEEGDREEERNLQEAADGREHRLEREDHDDERDQPDDQESTYCRVLGEEAPHDGPVMNARTASAAASREVPANQSSRFGPCAGAYIHGARIAPSASEP